MPHTKYDDDSEDLQHDEDDGYRPCPYCGETMLEAADYCPACDRWMSNEDRPDRQRSWWVVIVICALLTAMIVTLF